MTVAHNAPHVAVCALLAVATTLLLREGHRGRARPGHGRGRPHSQYVSTKQQDHDAIKEHDHMTRRRTITRTCATTGCRETSFVEYTARRDIADLPTKWQCYRHSKPNEVLSPSNPETHTTLALHPSYVTGYDRNDPPKLIGHYWGPEGAEKGNHGIVQGPASEPSPPTTRPAHD